MSIETIGKNKYRFIVNIGSGAARRRVTKTVYHEGGKKELKRLYQQFESEALNKPLSDITVGELLQTHLDFTRALGRRETTMHGYEAIVRRFNSDFKNLKAKDITTYHVERELGRMAKLGLSSKSLKMTLSLLHASYDHAIRAHQLEENPCKMINIPEGKKKREIRILHKDEIQPFLNALATVPLDDKVCYELALFMGLRRSEILGLKETDVDLVNRVLRIHNTRHRVDGQNLDQITKTRLSTRILALPDILVMDIAALLQSRQNFKYEKVDYLIQDGFGNVILPNTICARLRRMEEQNNLPNVTLHGLRHTYASLLNFEGVDIARISRELGHSNLATTMNIYTHIFEEASVSSRGIAKVINSLDFTKK